MNVETKQYIESLEKAVRDIEKDLYSLPLSEDSKRALRLGIHRRKVSINSLKAKAGR